ncbi:hypothetical protein N7539_008843 [Penicillium diatomitis]|uniref:Uncharacterized protein n=1 Tax=Penicillium diatomitis TaxID=2819901 RepID=A0A9W9WKK8_9EURO|nr:uncharacterized protein N7539_008843 [Penicillium diatomitis]KAJ5469225.1 hypothetical protein N7539_008843 [Penicillium diatomitis]
MKEPSEVISDYDTECANEEYIIGSIDLLFRETDLFSHAGTYPTTMAPQIVQYALIYRHSTMAPLVLPVKNYVNPYIQVWLPMSLCDNALFPALLFSSLSHKRINDLLAGGKSLPATELMKPVIEACYKEAIGAINLALLTPGRALTDATILAILMTVESPFLISSDGWLEEPPFQAHLQDLQWLSVHSAREPNLGHQEGLCKLINMRGGLARIETPGLAAAAFFRVLVNSTLLLSTPPLPFYPLSAPDVQNFNTQVTQEPRCESTCMMILHAARVHPLVSAVMMELVDYSTAVERYIRGSAPGLTAQIMCDRRNLAQYNLMSIPVITGGEPENVLSEICRIAAIIYSIGVTFPLSGVGAPFGSLVKQLKRKIQEIRLLEVLILQPRIGSLLLWATTMGAIAAKGKSERPFLTATLSKLIHQSGVAHWSDLKAGLRSILWLDVGEESVATKGYHAPDAHSEPLSVRIPVCRAPMTWLDSRPAPEDKKRITKWGSEDWLGGHDHGVAGTANKTFSHVHEVYFYSLVMTIIR